MHLVLRRIERAFAIVLSVAMTVVLALATVDLLWLIGADALTPPYLLISVDELLDIFGMFMLVLIGIELLETIIKTYLMKGHLHYEVVLSVAIIAVARKIIILDVKQLDGPRLLGIAGVMLALTAGFFLMRRSQSRSAKPSGPESPAQQGDRGNEQQHH